MSEHGLCYAIAVGEMMLFEGLSYHYTVSLVTILTLIAIKVTGINNEARLIGMEDPCAMQLRLESGSQSDNLACSTVEGNPEDQQCFNISDLCDGERFCTNGADEGLASTASQISCSKS